MKREIKFRAWDKDEKRMYWNVQNAYDTLGCHHKENICNCDENCDYILMCMSFGEVLENKDLIVMQFTGIKDKNGKEIYEGDIVQNEASTRKDKVVVKIEKGCTNVSHGFFSNDGETKPNEVVIGNVYENPELIKE